MPLPSPGVQYRGIQLHRVSFAVEGERPQDVKEEIPIEFQIATGDYHPHEMPVRFRCRVAVDGWFRVDVTYGVMFERDAAPESGKPRLPWNTIVAWLTPITLYPFCRETIAGLLIKAGIDTTPPPIVDFGRLFKPEEIDIPEAADGEGDVKRAGTPAG